MNRIINWFKKLQLKKIITVFLTAIFMLSIQACNRSSVAKEVPDKNAEMPKVINNYAEGKTFGEKMQDLGKDISKSAEEFTENITQGTQKGADSLQENVEGVAKDVRKKVERGTEDMSKNMQRNTEDTGDMISKSLKKVD
ncbi:MAG: hypothetical protein EAZ76_16790 [Nostocales cyanobacterium]|nr:MAG: hypothetical protein EAZ87_23700 [Nostocales cyanobacterium]TAF08516.1 MAG: hypothetical protein EAZ76_16790 [Nostocales cyanobacterium]